MKLFLVFVVAFLFTSCRSSSHLYNWDGYDKAVYRFYSEPGDESALNLKQSYISIIRKAKKNKKSIPPGVCADYGYLLLNDGYSEVALKYFKMEAELYPESEIFMQRIIKQTNETN